MPVTSTTSRNDYVGNGATTVYPYTFRIFAATDLRVTETDTNGLETTLTLNVDYTVDGVLSADGGNVTLSAVLAGDGTDENSHKLTIRRVLTATQPTDLRNQGKITAEILERALDRAVMLIQQLDDARARSLRLPESEAGSDTTTILPPLEERKGRGLYFDDTTGQPAAGSSILGTTVSGVMEAVVAAATRQIAMNLLAGGVTANRVLRGNGADIVLGQVALATDVSGELPFGNIDWTPNSITGAATATIDRLHLINLTSADAEIALPTAVGVADHFIGLMVASTNTKTATINPSGSQTAAGEVLQTMHKNGVMWLVSDGAKWVAVNLNPAPGLAMSSKTNAGQVVTGSSETVLFEDEEFDSHNAYDVTTGVFTAPSTGMYAISARVQGNADAYPIIYVNGSLKVNGINSYGAGTGRGLVSASVYLFAGETAEIRMSATITLDSTATNNTLSIVKACDRAA